MTAAVVASHFGSASQDDVRLASADEGFRIRVPATILELGRAGIQGVVASSALKVASLGEIAAIFSTTVGFRPVVPQDAKLFGVELGLPFRFGELVWIVV